MCKYLYVNPDNVSLYRAFLLHVTSHKIFRDALVVLSSVVKS